MGGPEGSQQPVDSEQEKKLPLGIKAALGFTAIIGVVALTYTAVSALEGDFWDAFAGAGGVMTAIIIARDLKA